MVSVLGPVTIMPMDLDLLGGREVKVGDGTGWMPFFWLARLMVLRLQVGVGPAGHLWQLLRYGLHNWSQVGFGWKRRNCEVILNEHYLVDLLDARAGMLIMGCGWEAEAWPGVLLA